MRVLSISLLVGLLSGCGVFTGAVLGSLLCGAGDVACRTSLIDQGLRADTGFVTVGGERYASDMVYDCRTGEGESMVLSGPGRFDASYACTQRAGTSRCACIGWSR